VDDDDDDFDVDARAVVVSRAISRDVDGPFADG